ncbi:MAG: S8 family serine peptidase [Kofleriaceae bacterium]|nr:S8 family serine peptidase [Kofleriaceae bacterium]MBP6838803.1 S8 family serine peptidase [Kofleriaceae bacterium]MBP9203761.1 S8 family serine peptidase [Kofleriaceae bacterium]
MPAAVHLQVVLALALTACVVGDPSPLEVGPGRRHVVLVAAGEARDLADALRTDGVAVDQVLSEVDVVTAVVDDATAQVLAARTDVAGVELDHGFVLSAFAGARAGARPAADATQTVPWGVARVGGGDDRGDHALWVLDGGVDLDHPDLEVDRVRSRDLVLERDPDDDADTSHGTAVAGVAAAVDNDRDVIGVAPGTMVVSVRVLDSGGQGAASDLLAGLDHTLAGASPGDVANISVVADHRSAAIERAVARLGDRGVGVVIAAGNDGADTAGYTPAGLDHRNVWTVGAVAQGDCQASFSNQGSAVDVAAPGVGVLTLAPGGGMVVVDGTSFAAPHVAGLLLLGGYDREPGQCAAGASAVPIAVAR